MEPLVRPATTDDADALVRMRAVMFAVMGASPEQLAALPWRDAAAAWFRTGLASPDFRAMVAEVDGQVVASACGQRTPLTPSPFLPTGAVGLLFNVATDPDHRGRGLASACTDAVLHWFDTETDVQRVDLFATDLGRGIYEVRGFAECAEPAMRRNRPR
jgi:GNAT superfamily N-acetyltransferase